MGLTIIHCLLSFLWSIKDITRNIPFVFLVHFSPQTFLCSKSTYLGCFLNVELYLTLLRQFVLCVFPSVTTRFVLFFKMKINNVNFFTRLARLAMLNVGIGSPFNSARTENLVNYVSFGGIPNLPFKQILLFFVLNVLSQIRSLTKKIPKLTLSLPVSRLRVGYATILEL